MTSGEERRDDMPSADSLVAGANASRYQLMIGRFG